MQLFAAASTGPRSSATLELLLAHQTPWLSDAPQPRKPRQTTARTRAGSQDRQVARSPAGSASAALSRRTAAPGRSGSASSAVGSAEVAVLTAPPLAPAVLPA